MRPPARIDTEPIPSLQRVMVNTNGSATKDGWENSSAGIGVWYANGSRHNIALKLENNADGSASKSRAELYAILETLRRNETDNLTIESKSLMNLRTICKESAKHEDQGWNGTQNSDLLKGILIRLRTRPARMEFRWVKGGNENNDGNEKANKLAEAGKEQGEQVTVDDERWIENHPALQDGARLQALEAMNIYNALLKWHTSKTPHILHQEVLDEAKNRVQETTELRPTNEKLLEGIRMLSIPPRVKDHMRNMLTGKIKCGPFWNKVPGHHSRANCSFCERKQNIDIVETETHLWLECNNNGQRQAWELAERLWRKTTKRNWPIITIGLIRGAAAISFEKDTNKDSERLRTLIPMTVWAIWKSKIKSSIYNQDVTPNETTQLLKELISDLIKKNWNATRFMEAGSKATRQRNLRKLWVVDRLTKFDPKEGPTVDFN